MKSVYINSRLEPLLIGERKGREPRDWIFSLGEPWLLLTPVRLSRLANRLGPGHGRIHRLLGIVRRHGRAPECFCRRLGVEETRYVAPADYPPCLCPHCDGVHNPHPEDAKRICPDCRERERLDERMRPGGGEQLDMLKNRLARRRMLQAKPCSCDNGVLSPHYRLNLRRRVERDWEKAANRIYLGCTYKQVAREFSCSVGLLHRKVKERPWENN